MFQTGYNATLLGKYARILVWLSAIADGFRGILPDHSSHGPIITKTQDEQLPYRIALLLIDTGGDSSAKSR